MVKISQTNKSEQITKIEHIREIAFIIIEYIKIIGW
jgi:hypothetical protein